MAYTKGRRWLALFACLILIGAFPTNLLADEPGSPKKPDAAPGSGAPPARTGPKADAAAPAKKPGASQGKKAEVKPEEVFSKLPKGVSSQIGDVQKYPGWKSLLQGNEALRKQIAEISGKKNPTKDDMKKVADAMKNAVYDDLKKQLAGKPELKELIGLLGDSPVFRDLMLGNPEIKKLLKDGTELKDFGALRGALLSALGDRLKHLVPGPKVGLDQVPSVTPFRNSKDVKEGDDMGIADRPPQPLGTPHASQGDQGGGNHAGGGGGGCCQGGGGGGSGAGAGGAAPGQARFSGNPNRIDEFERPENLGNRPAPHDHMMKAGNHGNPDFEIAAHIGPNTLAYCQMTLVKADAQGCLGTTADHCVRTETGRKALTYNTAYGLIQAEAVHSFQNSNNVETDMATVRFSGATCNQMIAEKVPVVPVAKTPPGPGDTVLAAVRFFGRVLVGQITSAFHDLTTNFNFLKSDGSGHQGGIHSGDSGGALLKYNNTLHRWELAGVLSASTGASQVHYHRDGSPTIGGLEGFYATQMAGLQRDIDDTTTL